MKNPFCRAEKDLSSVLHQLDAQLKDPNSELRQLLARLIRSEAKNAFSLMTGNELEIFDRLLADRVSRALSSLGSASPVLPKTAAEPTCTGCKTERFGAGIADFVVAPDCPVHGDPTVLDQIKDVKTL